MRTRACVGFKRSFAAANMLIYFDTNALRYKYTLHTNTNTHTRTYEFVRVHRTHAYDALVCIQVYNY